MSEPGLIAVVETPRVAPDFITGLPAEPWPYRIRLSGDTSLEEVSLVVALLATYGHTEPVHSLADLCANFPTLAPGGLAAVDGVLTIEPSCCCGLETWQEWAQVLAGGHSIWLGHDPAPWVEVSGGNVIVWPDGGLGGGNGEGVTPIRFTERQFQVALARASQDLHDFLQPLRAWAVRQNVGESHANQLVSAFESAFVKCESSE